MIVNIQVNDVSCQRNIEDNQTHPTQQLSGSLQRNIFQQLIFTKYYVSGRQTQEHKQLVHPLRGIEVINSKANKKQEE